jgi:RNA polymerase sigma-70 factor (ECF subfamily)
MALTDRERRMRLEGLFERHYPAVLAYALRRGPRSMADDVASETFVVAWRRLDDVPSEPLPWLYGVARRVLANQKRSSDRGERLSARLKANPTPSPPAPQVVGGGELLEAIWQLPENEREALMLVAWEGLSPAEAATAAACTRVALRARLYRARRRLASQLPALSGSAVTTGELAPSDRERAGEPDPITDRSLS